MKPEYEARLNKCRACIAARRVGPCEEEENDA